MNSGVCGRRALTKNAVVIYPPNTRIFMVNDVDVNSIEGVEFPDKVLVAHKLDCIETIQVKLF